MNPRLIRLVTSQFTQMQGLYTAVFGVFLLMIHVLNLMPNQDAIDGAVRMVVWLVPFMSYMWAIHAIPRVYARRFGRVVRNGMWDRPDYRFMLWLLTAAVLLSAHTQIRVLWLAWMAYPCYIAFSGWPYRLQHLLTGAAAVYALSRYLPEAARMTHGEPGFDFTVIATALVIAGLLDHLVLVRALAPHAAGSEDPAYDEDAG